jgi:hypothetical protein
MIQGFNKINNKIVPRLILSVTGHERHGKSSLGLSAPGPIVVFDLDKGLEGVARKFVDSKDVYTKEYKFSKSDTKDRFVTLWSAFRTDYYAALESPKVRTIIIDTATAAWDLIKLARIGLLGIPKEQGYRWGPINAEFIGLIDLAKDTNKNLILIHKFKAKYVNDVWNGEYVRSGFSQIGYLVQANIEVYRDGLSGPFGMRILDCRQNSTLGGLEFDLEDDQTAFPFLAQLVFPGTTERDWS